MVQYLQHDDHVEQTNKNIILYLRCVSDECMLRAEALADRVDQMLIASHPMGVAGSVI